MGKLCGVCLYFYVSKVAVVVVLFLLIVADAVDDYINNA